MFFPFRRGPFRYTDNIAPYLTGMAKTVDFRLFEPELIIRIFRLFEVNFCHPWNFE